MTENQLRKKIIALCLQMNATGLNQGTSGNISARFKQHMLITPSGIPYEQLKPADIAKMKIEGDDFKWTGPSKPSSEWHFHRAILRAKPELHAIVHTHSTFSTVLSIARDDIPACHYMIVSASMLVAMKDRTACLLANHGMVAGGKNLENAMWAAVELETLSRQYYYAKLAGNMVVLPDDEMERVLEKFKSYGQVLKSDKKKSSRKKPAKGSAAKLSKQKAATKKVAVKKKPRSKKRPGKKV